MKNKIWNFLTEHIKWVFSGIGIVLISSVINNTCSNGAEDKKTTVTNISGGNNSGTTITVGKNEGTIKPTNNTAETITHEEYKDNSRKIELTNGNYIENLHTPPSYREATIVQGENGNPVGVTDNPNVLDSALKLLTRVAAGEDVEIKEAYNTTSPKFLLNSGTEISRLESSGTGFAEFVKVKILEGAHKDETGWIHASTIHHEQRRK